MVFSYSNPNRLRQSHWEEEFKQQLFHMHSLKIKMKLTKPKKTFYQAPPMGTMESEKSYPLIRRGPSPVGEITKDRSNYEPRY